MKATTSVAPRSGGWAWGFATEGSGPGHYLFGGQDNDGYTSDLLVDWIDHPNGSGDITHPYADGAAGHVITLTVVSSGCGGQNRQTYAVTMKADDTSGSGLSTPSPHP